MPLELGRVVLSSIAGAANGVIVGNKERVVQSRAERIWQRIPKAPFCYLGWGLLGVWTNLMYLSPAFDFLALPIQSRSAFDLVVVAVMLVVAVVVWAHPSVSPLARKKVGSAARIRAYADMHLYEFRSILHRGGFAVSGAVGFDIGRCRCRSHDAYVERILRIHTSEAYRVVHRMELACRVDLRNLYQSPAVCLRLGVHGCRARCSDSVHVEVI